MRLCTIFYKCLFIFFTGWRSVCKSCTGSSLFSSVRGMLVVGSYAWSILNSEESNGINWLSTTDPFGKFSQVLCFRLGPTRSTTSWCYICAGEYYAWRQWFWFDFFFKASAIVRTKAHRSQVIWFHIWFNFHRSLLDMKFESNMNKIDHKCSAVCKRGHGQ